eukprot:5227438-Amphidinium_carterae.1
MVMVMVVMMMMILILMCSPRSQDGSLANYRNYARDLPLSEPPEAFGQHGNAEISSSMQEPKLAVS